MHSSSVYDAFGLDCTDGSPEYFRNVESWNTYAYRHMYIIDIRRLNT